MNSATQATHSSHSLLRWPLTDSGQAERIIALFGRDLRYCTQMQKWLVWDGRRWEIDERGAATQLAKEVSRTLFEHAGAVRSLQSYARKSESDARIRAALKRAATEPDIPVSADELDRQDFKLNCQNGVLDLRTGELRPHDRDYLITRVCAVDYDPGAGCPEFLKFLDKVSGGAGRLVEFLQRAFGYALTADVSEKAVFVFYGPNANNTKRALLTAFLDLLGSYGAQVSADMLMEVRATTAASHGDLAVLRGARLVTTSIGVAQDPGMYIASGFGLIKSRRKYENPLTFLATHKLFADWECGPTRGLWDRRLRLVSLVSGEDSDLDRQQLLDRLRAESAGILAWAVRGCALWLKVGLGEHPEAAVGRDADQLTEFLKDCCEARRHAWISTSTLADAYGAWCRLNAERFPLGRTQFAEGMRGKGYRFSRSRRFNGRQLRTWEGLALRECAVTSSQIWEDCDRARHAQFP